ncbi:uncharacterized protein LY89DRAFT_742408 [Mollisia scopiformis]|uniref:MARVEL domain-containing protein n=1 Tax=Mollisia scopiformis TaxID=149040 RepID=A0A132B8B1_MOLSC|nr:uncharacterized protein LY89DRAFT_742408 [Mollisia scopiformis]KUJ08114.1 hypothetical protein LY89DRAFT_742408 [Mollisia scopiformis]
MPNLDGPQVWSFMVRTAQISIALAGISLVTSFHEDTLDNYNAFTSPNYINFLLAVFVFGVLAPLISLFILLETLSTNRLGARQNLIIFIFEMVLWVAWVFTAISMLMRCLGKSCFKAYAGPCVLAFPISLLGFLEL